MADHRKARSPMLLLEAWARGARTNTPFEQATADRLFPTAQLANLNVKGEISRLAQLARETEANARHVRRWLEEAEAIATSQSRFCTHCGKLMAGRRDRAYCSTNCRVKAHHQRT